MNARACKGCIHFVPFYGTKNKQGKPTVSNYWCVKARSPKEAWQKYEDECRSLAIAWGEEG